MRLLLCPALIAAVLTVGVRPAPADPPKGYREVKITDDPGTYEYFPKINNRGQIVFTSRNPGEGTDHNDEIFLYDNGELIQITDDNKEDKWPDINDDGTIVWSRGIGPEGEFGKTFEIMMRAPDGVITRITDDDRDDYAPRINNLGHFVWERDYGYGCALGAWRSEIFFFDGQSEQRLTFDAEGPDAYSNQARGINDHDEMVWTRYNFCVVGWWESDIRLYKDGRIRKISPDSSYEPQTPTINNDGVVVWMNNFNRDGRAGIQMWQDGVVTDLTEWGAVPVINSSGDIAFDRWYDDEHTYEVWLYHSGRFTPLTSDRGYNYVPSLNDAGDVVFQHGAPFGTDVRLLIKGGGLDQNGNPRLLRRR